MCGSNEGWGWVGDFGMLPVVRSIVASRAAEVTYIPLEDTAGVQEWREAIDEGVKEADALLVGCGLGRAESAWELAKGLLLDSHLTAPPAVVDADGLNALASEDGWWKKLGREAVLTPHPGEMSRLMGASTGEVQRDRIGTAREAARKWGKTVVLKGCAYGGSPSGRPCRSEPVCKPGAGVGGHGDVLAGTIAGLLAQGLGVWEAQWRGIFARVGGRDGPGRRSGRRGCWRATCCLGCRGRYGGWGEGEGCPAL